MTNPSVIITGAGGFIGSHLVNHFSGKGMHVSALVHTLSAQQENNAEYTSYDLKDVPDDHILTPGSTFIHCAYVSHTAERNSDKINIEGTLQLWKKCRQRGIRKMIFLSSMSAHEKALSHYGRHKHYLENRLIGTDTVILKPGLVLGKGGLLAGIAGNIQNNKVVPIAGKGRQPLQTVHIDDLAAVINNAVEKDLSGSYVVAESEPITLRMLYETIGRILNRRIIFMPIPYALLGAILRTTDFLGILPGISYENYLGMKSLTARRPCDTANVFGVTVRDFNASIRDLENYLQSMRS